MINDENNSSSTDETNSQARLPVIIPSFDESSSNILQTHQISTTVQDQRQSQETMEKSSNNNEYVNPRGIRFTTASLATNESVHGKSKVFCK